MKRKTVLILLMSLALLSAGCSQADTVKTAASENTTSSTGEDHAIESTVTLTERKYSEEKLDADWKESTSTLLTLKEDTITCEEDSVSIDGSTATITKSGTYVLTGELSNGQIIVDTGKESSTKLVLNNAAINCSTSAAVYIKSGDTVVTLAENSENSITDGSEYISDSEENPEPEAAIFAKDDLTFNGTGSLTVSGNYNHAIQSKDALKFVNGSFTVTSVGDGLVGKDSVSIKDGDFTITSGGDGIKATNTEETDKGYIIIEDGSFQITTEKDAIQAETLLRINDGTFDIQTGGGSENAVQSGGAPGGQIPQSEDPGMDRQMPQGENPGMDRQMPQGEKLTMNEQTPQSEPQTDASTEPDSTKGLKSYVELIVESGEFTINSYDDALHSNQNVTIDGGSFTITSGDDGIHADNCLTVNGGFIDIQQSYEGLEGFDIILNDGNIKAVANDDGVNAAGDNDSASNPETDYSAEDTSTNDADNMSDMRRGGESMEHGGVMGAMAGEDQGATLTINGGTLYVNAEGDGLDANGDILISGGEITVHGPTNGGNGTLDYASECQITGGTFLAVGSVGMVQNPSDTSTQPVIICSTNQSISAGTTITVKDSGGDTIAEITAEKNIQWFSISTPALKKGETYTVCVGDTETEVTLDSVLTQL